jgi:hypothetical protein
MSWNRQRPRVAAHAIEAERRPSDGFGIFPATNSLQSPLTMQPTLFGPAECIEPATRQSRPAHRQAVLHSFGRPLCRAPSPSSDSRGLMVQVDIERLQQRL